MANMEKYKDNSKYMYSGYGVEYDGEGSWSCGNDFGRNVTNSGVDNS